MVAGEGLDGGDQQALVARGAQPGVELVAGAGPVRDADEPDDAAARAGEVGVRVAAGRRLRRVEEEEHVEVRPVADLPAAELAHGEDGEALHRLPRRRAQRVAGGGLELGVGERGERERGLPRAELAGEIGEADLERDAGLGAAQGLDQGLVVVAVARRGAARGHLAQGGRHLGPGQVGRGGPAGEEHDVAELGVVGERVADEGARAERLDEAADGALVVAEELDVDAGPLHPGEEDAQVAGGLLGVGGVDDGLEHGLGEGLELLAGAARRGGRRRGARARRDRARRRPSARGAPSGRRARPRRRWRRGGWPRGSPRDRRAPARRWRRRSATSAARPRAAARRSGRRRAPCGARRRRRRARPPRSRARAPGAPRPRGCPGGRASAGRRRPARRARRGAAPGSPRRPRAPRGR